MSDIVDALRNGGRDDEHWFLIGAEAANEIERLRRQLVLAKAEGDGAGSLLLDVQQECIGLRREIERLRDMLKDAALQLEYMQERMPTGTSTAMIARINNLLAETVK